MRTLSCIVAFIAALAVAHAASAHAFPDDSSPHVGATLTTAPKAVKIWFDGELEPVFSTLVVTNGSGKQVSGGKGRVDPANPRLLETALPVALPAGQYKVDWSAVAHDGHHTAGHFTFTVK